MWIPSKLTLPNFSHYTIVRSKIVENLRKAKFTKLVLFIAPAGYGKTTAASSWLSDKQNVGWYSVDESDNDPYSFITYFLRAVNSATKNACIKTLSLAEKRQFSSLTTLFSDVLANLIEFKEECYITIDDYHLIDLSEINEALRFFLKHLPDNVTLVVTSRTLPALGIANLRVRDQIIEIGTEQLAFDANETMRFFKLKEAGEIDRVIAENLTDYIEGWPSALQLMIINMLRNI